MIMWPSHLYNHVTTFVNFIRSTLESHSNSHANFYIDVNPNLRKILPHTVLHSELCRQGWDEYLCLARYNHLVTTHLSRIPSSVSIFLSWIIFPPPCAGVSANFSPGGEYLYQRFPHFYSAHNNLLTFSDKELYFTGLNIKEQFWKSFQ